MLLLAACRKKVRSICVFSITFGFIIGINYQSWMITTNCVQSGESDSNLDSYNPVHKAKTHVKSEIMTNPPDVIRNCCQGNEKEGILCSPSVIPKLVHIVWFNQTNRTELRFHHLMTLLSVTRFIKPRTIIFHGDSMPTGKWWDYFIQKSNTTSTKVKHSPATAPTEIFGHPIKVYEHQTDIVRHEILLKYGGIYTDLDVIFVKSLDSLLCYDMVMGEELKGWLTNGIMLAKRQAPFLKEWYRAYKKNFNDYVWNLNSVVLPGMIWKIHPEMIHVEHNSMNHPTWESSGMQQLYGEGDLYDWSNNYCVHLWYRKYDIDLDPETIKPLNTTVGQLFRYIYYGQLEIPPE